MCNSFDLPSLGPIPTGPPVHGADRAHSGPDTERRGVERADAARNRRLLLAAAKRLIDGHGAAAVTMDAVARQAGVGKGTVFRRFGSRTGLMLALLDHSESELQEAFLSGPDPLGPGAPPLERLLAYGRARLKMTADHLDVLQEAGAGSGEFMSHPVWRTSTQHVQILLRQLGLTGPLEVLTTAIHVPLGASAVLHLTTVSHLDLKDITTQWELMVRMLLSDHIAEQPARRAEPRDHA